jgi:two-component system, chemotaxis family, chemotaxis protein CheY
MDVPQPHTPRSSSDKRFLRVLYADDVDDLRELARLSFSREGHGIECVSDGMEACDRLAAEPGFDLVITDHHMPNMNGLELVMHLRAMNYSGRVVVVSSELAPSVDEEYRRLNVDGIIHKPVFPTMLRNLLAELFPNVVSATDNVTTTPASGSDLS